MSLGGALPSATHASITTSYYAARDSGGSIVGVQSLNALIGSVAIAGDTSIGITKPGLGVIQVSTAGLPQVPSSVTATGAVVGATVTATGALNGASAVVAGNVSSATLAVSATAAVVGKVTTGNYTGDWMFWASSGQIGAGNAPSLGIFDFAAAAPYGSAVLGVCPSGLYWFNVYGNTGVGTGTSTSVPTNINIPSQFGFPVWWNSATSTCTAVKGANDVGSICGPTNPEFSGEGLVIGTQGTGVSLARSTTSGNGCSYYSQVYRMA